MRYIKIKKLLFIILPIMIVFSVGCGSLYEKPANLRWQSGALPYRYYLPEYKYDDAQNLIEKTLKSDEKPDYNNVVEYHYDSAGRRTMQLFYDTENGREFVSGSSYACEYLDDGSVKIYNCDENGEHSGMGLQEESIYKFDENGNCTHLYKHYLTGDLAGKTLLLTEIVYEKKA